MLAAFWAGRDLSKISIVVDEVAVWLCAWLRPNDMIFVEAKHITRKFWREHTARNGMELFTKL